MSNGDCPLGIQLAFSNKIEDHPTPSCRYISGLYMSREGVPNYLAIETREGLGIVNSEKMAGTVFTTHN